MAGNTLMVADKGTMACFSRFIESFRRLTCLKLDRRRLLSCRSFEVGNGKCNSFPKTVQLAAQQCGIGIDDLASVRIGSCHLGCSPYYPQGYAHLLTYDECRCNLY